MIKEDKEDVEEEEMPTISLDNYFIKEKNAEN
jgi:hypothetical protein